MNGTLAPFRVARIGSFGARPHRVQPWFLVAAMLAFAAGALAQAPFGNWLDLDGANDSATCPDSTDLSLVEPGSFTVEAWFQADNTEPYPMQRRPLVVKRGAWSLSVEMDASYMGGYDCIAFSLYTDDNSLTGSAYCLSSLSTGWHHVAMVLDNPGNVFELYLDGQRRNSVAQPAALRDSTYVVEIGRAAYSAYTWDGRIDGVRISSTVRYSGTTYSVPTSPFECDGSTAALWHFDECAGATTFYDGPDGAGILCGTIEDTLAGVNGAATGAPACTYAIDPVSASYPVAGGSGSVTVTAPPCCAWTAVANDAWITVTGGASGTGNGTVSYSVAANSGAARSGTITVGGQTFTVTQAAPCSYGIDPSSADYPLGGGSGTVSVTADAGCGWTAASNAGWITIDSGASGTGNGSVGYSVGVNSGSARSGTVTIAGHTFTVNQASGCSYAIDPTSASFPVAGGDGIVSVTAGANCGWTAVSNDAWITVDSGASGSGGGSVGYSVAANAGAARVGTVTIAARTFTVTQASPCEYAIDPSSASHLASGGSGSVSVTVAASCGWTAVSNDAWITVDSGASGSGNGSVGYTVAANSGAPRTGTVTVAGLTFTVNQESNCTYAIAPTSAMLGSGGGTGNVTVTTQPGCAWAANVEPWAQPWLAITSGGTGTGSGTLTFQATASTSACRREGFLTIAGKDFPVRQEAPLTTASWAMTGDMSVARSNHMAVRLLDGRVLVAGGDTGGGVLTASAEIFDPATGTWAPTNPMNTVRQEFSGVLMPDGRVFVAGYYSDTAEIFDPADESWTALPPMSCQRPESRAVVLLDGRILVAGARSPCGISSEIYDPLTGQWTIAYLHQVFYGHTLTRLQDGRVLIAGNQHADPTAAEVFDPTTNSWATTGSMNYQRFGHGAGLLPNGRVIAVGGQMSNTSEEYDPETGGWTLAGSPITSVTVNPTSQVLLDGRVLVVEGLPQVYSAVSRAWSAITAPPRGHSVATATLLRDGRVLVAGGGNAYADLLNATADQSLSPGFAEFPIDGGPGSIAVQASTACEWRARSSRDWIAVTSGGVGGGPGNVGYSVAAGGEVARAGAIVVEPDLFFAIQDRLRLAVTLSGTGGGHVGSSPPGIDCGSTCTAAFPYGTPVSLTATPAPGSGLVGWSGDCSGTSVCDLTMTEGRTVDAEFGLCVVTLDPDTASFDSAGGGGSFTVLSPTGCPGWTAVSDEPWITVTSAPSGSGNGTIEYSVAANPGPDRTGTITVEGGTFAVTQASGCVFTIDPTSATVGAAGGGGSVGVTAYATCPWTAVSNDTWIAVTSGPGGIGNGSVTYTVAATDGPSRTGTIVIAGQTFSIDQASGCFITLAPTSASFPPAGGSGSVAVAVGAGCDWTAVAADPWIEVTSGATGSGPGGVGFSVAANSGSPRAGSIAIGGRVFTVSQGLAFVQVDDGLIDLYYSAAAWGDFDNDGDLDLALVGQTSSSAVSKIYRNDGGWSFTDLGESLEGVWWGSVAWGDYDRDGDLDLALTGWSASGSNTGRLYRNEGGGAGFTDLGLELGGGYRGQVAWADYDNDGDIDLLVGGGSGGVRIFRNDAGAFTQIDTGVGYVGRSLSWGDYDNDGDLDIVAPHHSWTAVYRNDDGRQFIDIGAGLTSVMFGAVAWGDYDNDGDLDIVATGWDSPDISVRAAVSKIFRNDGGGVFTDIEAGLAGFAEGSAAWGDYDNDGDLDLLLTGDTDAAVYRNDGNGSFADIGAGLDDFSRGAGAWGDYDNDGDLDILLTGAVAGNGLTKIYRNVGGVPANTPPGAPGGLVSAGGAGQLALSWGPAADAETPSLGLGYNLRLSTMPGGIDIVSPMAALGTGWRRLPQRGYLSPGTPIVIKPLPPGTYYWSVQAIDPTFAGSAFAVEGSVTVCGASLDPPEVNVPASGASDTVTVDTEPGCDWSAVSNESWISIDSGATGSGDGSVGYSVAATDGPERTGTVTIAGQIHAVHQASGCTYALWPQANASFGSAGGDGSAYVLCGGGCPWTATSNAPWLTITGGTPGSGEGEVTYSVAANAAADGRSGTLTLGGQTFTVTQAGIQFVDTGVSLGHLYSGSAVAWGDYDNDGDLDLVVAGNTTSGYVSKLLRNDGVSGFVQVAAGLEGVWSAVLAWGDYDRDGDLDLLLAGRRGAPTYQPLALVYRNDGGGVFADIGAGLTGVFYGAGAWGDYDNDGDLDIVLTGYTGSARITNLYRNDGGGSFVPVSTGLPGIYDGALAWGDYDNDGDLDLLLAGESTARIFRNSGGVFADIGAGLTSVSYAAVAFGDYDDDGDLDLFLAGQIGGGALIAKVYRNDGGAFVDTQSGLAGIQYATPAWGDYDNDGDLDLVVTGSDAWYSGFATVYRNEGGSFVDTLASVPGDSRAGVAWGDYDNDGDLDLACVGTGAIAIYRNDESIVNTVPAAPTGLSTPMGAGQVTLSWVAATDAQTPSPGLTYNLRASTAPGGLNLLSPMASVPDGWRRIPALGNAQHGSTAIVRGLPPGTYYWSVQAVDTAFAGSPFAPEGTFTLCSASIDPTSALVPQPGGNGSVSVTTEVGCAWTAQSNAPWVSITSGGSGSGGGSVSYAVTPNQSTTPRSGTLTIAGQTFTVDQDEFVCDVALSPSSLPAGVREVAYAQTISASGGIPAFTFTVSEGALPPGLNLASGGLLSGTPTLAGSFDFTVRAADSIGCVGTHAYSLDVAAIADLSLAKGDSPDPVDAGAALEYTLNAANAGPSTATGLTVTDTLPAGVGFVSASGSGWSCGQASGVVTCSRAALAIGAAPPIAIQVTAPAEGGAITNSAAIAASENDPSGGNNTASAGTTVVAVADLSLVKGDSPDPVAAGAVLTYTLTATNAGPSTATALTVTDTLPTEVSFTSATGTGWACGHASGVVTCTRPSLAVGSAPALTIEVTAPSEGGSLTNHATIAAAENDPDPSDNDANAQTAVTAWANLSLAKSDSPDPVVAGETLTYTLVVSNAGESTATGLVLADTLPVGVGFVSAAGDGWSCGRVDRLVTCTRPALAVGAAPAVTITVTAPLVCCEILNEALVTATEADPQPADNAASASTTVDVPPTVENVDSVRPTGDGGLAEGEVTERSITQLLIDFSEAMADPPGHGSAGDVTNPANYQLLEAGANATFDTAPCTPVGADDLEVAIAAVTYFPGPRRAVLAFASPHALPAGFYRLAACGTLTDATGRPLDGDGDGWGGDPFIRSFRTSGTNLLANPNLDTDLTGWVTASPLPGEIQWGVADADGAPTSGSAEVQTSAGAAETFVLAQCVVSPGGGRFRGGGVGRIASGSTEAPTLRLRAEWFAGPLCEDGVLATVASSWIVGDTYGSWSPAEFSTEQILGAGSLRLMLEGQGGSASAFSIDLDNAELLWDPPLFADGFESGDCWAWDAVTP